MTDMCYQKLAEHLDRLVEGFPPSRTGAHLRLLEGLFTPEEASLAVHLTLDKESAAAIAARAGLPVDETQPRLDEMAQKGLIISFREEDGDLRYCAAPFVVGIYEFQINRLNPGFLRNLYAYWSTTVEQPHPGTLPQMRTIPIRQSIQNRVEALPYEQVEALVRSHDRYAVTACICRKTAKITGRGCTAPLESCLVFGEWADYYVRTGRGRSVTREEMFTLLERADAANLVLQPSNSREIAFICCCCGCCCGVLHELQNHPRPADAVASAFIARHEPDTCDACWTCLERCQMGALVEVKGQVEFKAERCIGCGLCVSTCPTGSLTLERKPQSRQKPVPADVYATWRTISQERSGGSTASE